MAVTSTWSVVRDILTADMSLTADQVIARAKAEGVKAPDAAIRSTVHTLRKRLKKRAAAAPKAVPTAARQKAAPSPSAVVRSILADDPGLSADGVMAAAKARGVALPDAALRKLAHNVRSELKKAGPPPGPAPVAPAGAPAGVAGVLSNVAGVAAAVAACGGVGATRQAAEAVRACGGVDAFLQYLDLVAGIRTAP